MRLPSQTPLYMGVHFPLLSCSYPHSCCEISKYTNNMKVGGTPTRGLHLPLLLSPQRPMRSHGSSSNNGIYSIFQNYRYWKNYRVNAWDAGGSGVAGNEAHGWLYSTVCHMWGGSRWRCGCCLCIYLLFHNLFTRRIHLDARIGRTTVST